jgi:hypothetical protein
MTIQIFSLNNEEVDQTDLSVAGPEADILRVAWICLFNVRKLSFTGASLMVGQRIGTPAADQVYNH